MSALFGYPDFGARLASPDFRLHSGWEASPYVLWPDGLGVASTADGKPDFALSLVRRAGAGDPYGALALRIGRLAHTDAALYLARQSDDAAVVNPVSFSTGYLRLEPAGAGIQIPADLARPTPIGWGGIDSARWAFRLSVESAELLKTGMTGEALLLNALAEVEVLGIAPRLPVKVQLNPAEILRALAVKDSRVIVRDELVAFLQTGGSRFLSVDNVENLDTALLGETVADRLHARFAKFLPAPIGGNKLLIEFNGGLPGGPVTWDLAEVELVPRLYSYTLDPFDAARKLVAANGIGAVVTETTIPAVNFGFWEVAVDANLPPARTGIVDLRLVITAPEAPPARIDPVVETIELEEPEDSGKIEFRLSPAEPLHYTYQAIALLQQGDSTKELKGPPTECERTFIELRGADFPLDFVAVSAEPALLALCTLSGTLDYRDGDTPVSQPFTLADSAPRATLGLPPGTPGTLSFSAQPKDGGPATTLGPYPATSRQVGLLSFREYGPHRVQLACTFPKEGGAVTAIDLLPEGMPETPEHLKLVYFKPGSAVVASEYTYLATSPFHPGYRWRNHSGGAWSAVLSPFAPLTIQGDVVVASKPTVYDLRGVHLYRKPQSLDSVYYLPGSPTPQTDGAGRPMLTLIANGESGMLQLSTCWGLDQKAQTELQADLVDTDPSLQGVLFHPAPVAVGNVTLLLDADGSGTPAPLRAIPSSGYPPYSAVFNVPLTPAQRASAISAINGRAGLFLVQYEITLSPEVAATLPDGQAAQKRVTDVASWFSGGDGQSHILMA